MFLSDLIDILMLALLCRLQGNIATCKCCDLPEALESAQLATLPQQQQKNTVSDKILFLISYQTLGLTS